jgi:hypothetical protein
MRAAGYRGWNPGRRHAVRDSAVISVVLLPRVFADSGGHSGLAAFRKSGLQLTFGLQRQ